MKIKKSMILAFSAAVMLTGCGNSQSASTDGATKDTTFSVWLGKVEDSAYYSDYRENPVLQLYLEDSYLGKDNKEVKIDFEFQTPAAGSEKDNFNTMIATGDYADMMDVDHYAGNIVDLYDEGVALDLTEYIEKYMPNYVSFLEKNPELGMTAVNMIDGEKKYLTISSYMTTLKEWQGFMYRRDWVVKYGKHPATGEVFHGEYTIKNEDGTWNTDSWLDDVVFPSGGSDPVYISDWEWMFEIFDIAMEDLGITDGYGYSSGYMGFSKLGVLNSSFGGGSALWYVNQKTGQVGFGGYNDEMRAYLQCLNTWYQKGWLDKSFAEHTGQMPWRVDEAKVRQGKVGLWVGMETQLFNRMATEDELTKDILVFACSYPINDIYGDEEQQNKEPYCLYKTGAQGKRYIITDKAEEKDIIALFSFLNVLYDEENAFLNYYGLSKEEYEKTQNEYYTKWGLIEGAYIETDKLTEEGKRIYYFNPILATDSGSMNTAMAMSRMPGLQMESPTRVAIDGTQTEMYRHMKHLWEDVYQNTGLVEDLVETLFTPEQTKEMTSIETNVNEFMEKNISSFINGSKDPFNDNDWEAYSKALSKYNPERGTEIYQGLYDQLVQ